MAGAPLGNRNGAKKNRLLTDALRRELVQNPDDAVAIARKTIECAKNGEAWAQALAYERLDGKVPQAIVGDDEEDPVSIREILIRAVDAASDRASPESS